MEKEFKLRREDLQVLTRAEYYAELYTIIHRKGLILTEHLDSERRIYSLMHRDDEKAVVYGYLHYIYLEAAGYPAHVVHEYFKYTNIYGAEE